jgi:hypothetical protein
MRGALIHGVLLVVMLVYGYRTWTRDKTVKPDLGSVVLWDKTEADLVSIELKTENRITKLEHRGQGKDAYWWGIETTIEKKVKPKPPEPPKPAEGSGSAAGSGSAGSGSAGSGSAGSAAGSGSGAGSAAPPAEEETRKTTEFPLGEAGEKIVKGFTDARALRDLHELSEDLKKEYKLNDAKMTLTVKFKDEERSFLVGGSVYGGSDRYIVDQKTKHAYLLSRDLTSGLEAGEASLHLLDPRGFDLVKAESVTIEGGGKSKTITRVQTGVEGQQIKTWGDPTTKKADQTIANFVDNANTLRPTEYRPGAKLGDLTQVLKLTYKDAGGGVLGTMTLYKHEKPGELAPGAELDMANPPKGDTEYLIVTEKTRVPAVVRRDMAQRTEQDITTVFGEHATTATPPVPNPFGNAPLPERPKPPKPGEGSGSAGAATPPAGAGSAAPAGGGSAAPAKTDAPKGDAPKGDAPKGAAPKGDAKGAKSEAPKGGW